MKKEYRRAWREGLEARKAGHRQDANPFPHGDNWCSEEYLQWHAGWTAEEIRRQESLIPGYRYA